VENACPQGRGRAPRFRRSLIACFLSFSFLQAGVLHTADKLTDDEKIALVRDLAYEYANVKVLLPRSKKPLELSSDGTWDKGAWKDAGLTQGVAARLGDKVQITKLTLDGDHIVFEINGGIKGGGGHWYDHVQGGIGGPGPVTQYPGTQAAMGTYISLDFHKPMENLTSAEVKKLLAPVLDFDKRSATVMYSETLSPELTKAIAEKRALVGMDRDQVLAAMGHPDHKYRETKDGIESEDWIFGAPPGKVTFVTFNGSKVVKVKDEYAGLGGQTNIQ
jgi:hypothetical protein